MTPGKTIINLELNGSKIMIPVSVKKPYEDMDIKFETFTDKPKEDNKKGKREVEPIQRPAINSKDEVLEDSDLKKGITVDDKRYTFTSEEIKAFNISRKGIEVLQFTPIANLQILYVKETFYIYPDKKGIKGYVTFANQMAEKGVMAICKVINKGRDRIAVIRSFEDGLILHDLYYSNEVRSFGGKEASNIEIPNEEKIIVNNIIDGMNDDEFNLSKYHNEYNQGVMDLVSKKSGIKMS